MPDTSLAKSLLSTARSLTNRISSQANLRRAVSTAYYAMFHALAKVCADALVGPRRSQRSNKAWVEVYRGLGHGPCKDSCTKANSIGFPDEIQDFADNFVQLQDARERADYDPTFKLTQEQAKVFVSWAEQSIVSLNQVSAIDKTAFAAWVLITTRGAVHARKLSKEALSAAE